MANWEDFCEAVLTTGVKARTASAQTLDAHEVRIGFPLPALYREFASTFGAGQLLFRKGRRKPSFLIFIPGQFSPPPRRHYDIDVLNQEMQKAQKPGARPDRAHRLVFFAKDLSKNYYGWDPEEVTRPESHDYAIYRRRLGATAIKQVASTFEEFLVVFCVGEPLAAWKEAGGPLDHEVPREKDEDDEEERDKKLRILFHPNFYAADFQDEDEDANEDDEDEEEGQERVEVIHRLMIAPVRFGPEDEGLLWNEYLPDGEVSVRMWTPDDEDDAERLEAFWDACQEVDWDDIRIHEIPATEIKRREVAMPVPAPPLPPREGSPPELTDQGLIRRKPHDPAPVAESWRRIEAWMSRHCPEVIVALQPGASDAEIARFEKAIGQELPEDVKASYRIHDGLGFVPDEYEEMVRGEDGFLPVFSRSVFYDYSLASIRDARGRDSILRNWQDWTDIADEVSEESEGDSNYGHFESFPDGAIKRRYACRGWIPFCGTNSGYLGVDLDPGPTGVRGQVINFGRDEDHKSVLATSWAQFLEDYADELEAGNFDIEDDGSDRRLQMKRPKVSPIYCNYRAWAEAKLDPAFQAARPVPVVEPVPADPETDRECREVVEGFLSEHHDWEVRWLAVRPVKELGFWSISEGKDGDFGGSIPRRSEFVDRGLPVPEAAEFATSRAWNDPVKKARWLKKNLKFGQYYAPAMAERRAIFARFTTAWAQGQQGETFGLRREPKYDPGAQKPAEVLRRDETTAFVVLTPRDGQTDRFLLKREDGAWRIELFQVSNDGGPFSARSM